jgi:hypothetical protein
MHGLPFTCCSGAKIFTLITSARLDTAKAEQLLPLWLLAPKRCFYHFR